MEEKFCSNCGAKLKKNQAFCSECGTKIGESENKNKSNKEDNGIEIENIKKKKVSFWDIVRYVIGGFFCYIGLSDIIRFGSFWELSVLLLGLSFFPFIYRKFVCRFIKNYKLLKVLQIVLPIILFIFSVSITPSNGDNNTNNNYNNNNSPAYKNETAEEKALRIVSGKLTPASQKIISSNINSETGNYDFKIKYDKSQLSAYVCASDLQYLAKQVVGVDKIGSIEFECAKNDETFYYVLVENINTLSSDLINENTKYYDVNHNQVNTNIDKLKKNVVNDYKKSCSSYSYKDVLRNPSDYNGKQAYWFGEIVQVVDKTSFYSVFRINVTCEKYSYSSGYYCNDTIYVTYYGDESFIEDDMVKMWGTMNGTETYTTVLGASVTIPKFAAQYMELQ